jgi:predicted ATPase
MMATLAIAGYRSLRDFVVPLRYVLSGRGAPHATAASSRPAALHTQVIVMSHAPTLIETLRHQRGCGTVRVSKTLGETAVDEASGLSRPPWKWPGR